MHHSRYSLGTRLTVKFRHIGDITASANALRIPSSGDEGDYESPLPCGLGGNGSDYELRLRVGAGELVGRLLAFGFVGIDYELR